MLARSLGCFCVVWACVGCKPTENFLGTNGPAMSGAGGGVLITVDAGTDPVVEPASPTTPAVEDAGGMPAVVPTAVPTEYPQANVPLPNYFVDVLGLAPEEVDQRLEDVYDQLFHGSADESVFVDVGGDEAYIYDVFHDDTRMDAVGYGLMFSVQMNRQSEFDAIWAFAKRRLRYHEGPSAGFYHQECNLGDGPCEPDGNMYGLFGTFYAATALIFADGRWSSVGKIDYAGDVRELLTLMQGSTLDASAPFRAFDPMAYLPYASPEAPAGRVTAIDVVPAFFQSWAAWANSPFWAQVAAAGRTWLHASADPNTGLVPSTALFDGELVAGDDTVDELAYHVGFHLALDQAWYGPQVVHSDILDDQVAFFGGMERLFLAAQYASSGAVIDSENTGALTMLTGAAAALTMDASREDFIRRVWDFPTPVGLYRYFDGMNHAMALLFLAGRFQAWN